MIEVAELLRRQVEPIRVMAERLERLHGDLVRRRDRVVARVRRELGLRARERILGVSSRFAFARVVRGARLAVVEHGRRQRRFELVLLQRSLERRRRRRDHGAAAAATSSGGGRRAYSPRPSRPSRARCRPARSASGRRRSCRCSTASSPRATSARSSSGASRSSRCCRRRARYRFRRAGGQHRGRGRLRLGLGRPRRAREQRRHRRAALRAGRQIDDLADADRLAAAQVVRAHQRREAHVVLRRDLGQRVAAADPVLFVEHLRRVRSPSSSVPSSSSATAAVSRGTRSAKPSARTCCRPRRCP